MKFPFAPVIVNVNVPVLAFGLAFIVSVELPGVVTGLVLKLAVLRLGTPLTLRFTELDELPAPTVTE